jgi:para-aminobenzoate synthetase component I
MQPIQPWYWRSQPLNHRTGAEIFAALFLSAEPGAIATLLESPSQPSPDQPQLTRYSICAGGPRQIDEQPQCWTPPVGEILPFLQRLLDRPSTPHPDAAPLPDHLPFTGGWLGWLGYDLAWEIEQLPTANPDPLPFPVAYWYEPECFAVLDHADQILWLAATALGQLDDLQNRLLHQSPQDAMHRVSTPLSTVNSQLSTLNFPTAQADYETAIRKAQQHIQAGDIFQANLSLRFAVPTTAASWDIYQALQQINPSPFASYWSTPWGAVISCSPERLVQLQQRQAQTRPIAGTRPRGTTPDHDRQLAIELLANPKEQAEHIMLVDLERNDLGRVCEWGTVEVDELLVIERYSHVMHLVSNVKGILRDGYRPIDLIRAVFPGGTITGCPKVRCMEIIETLEPVRRNLFYGSCGYLDRRGNLDLNILIRTLLYIQPKLQDDQDENSQLSTLNCPLSTPTAIVYGQVGAGIVADSDPAGEWLESLQKAQAQLAALRSV